MLLAMPNPKVPEGASHDRQDAVPDWSADGGAPNPFELSPPPAVDGAQVGLRVSRFGFFHGSGPVGGWTA